MAGSTHKILNKEDVINRSTLLHEAIPITGSLLSGTYANSAGSDENVKNYSHGQFQSVYDYPYLSSSANHILDITCGYSNLSALSSSSNTQNAKKINIYNQMAQVLAGYDHTGSILRFDEAGETVDTGTKMDEVYFLNFSRLLVKDEIKKGTFELELGVRQAFDHGGSGGSSAHTRRIKLVDYSGSDGYKVNSPAGEYGVLYAQTSHDGDSTLSTNLLEGERIESNVSDHESWKRAGLLYYQAGIAVVSGSVFGEQSNAVLGTCGLLSGSGAAAQLASGLSGSGFNTVTGSTIETMTNGLRNRIYNVQFNNTTELNSTIYFCRVNHNEFNYSTNPTFTSGSQIVVKENKNDTSKTYITTIGLYNANDELLAVAKTSEPLVKTPEDELTLRVRLDY
jgi:hypothetical protein